MQKPSVGRIVHVIGPDAETNGSAFAPAIITRVWNETMVNLTMFPDDRQPVVKTSVVFCHGTEDDARKYRTNEYALVAFWPPRV